MKHAYIDESGTREYQKVMTVALVVLEGKRTAEKLHEKLMCELYPDYIERRKLFKKKSIHKLPGLHYAEMNRAQKEKVAKKLASVTIFAYVSYYYHDGTATEHQQRFEIYTQLVKDSIRLATDQVNELSVVVAQQGGWQGYEQQFEAELKALEYDTHPRKYRKLLISLEPARHPGIQLSDFYAGCCRDFVLDPDSQRLVHYHAIERQTRLEQTTFVRSR